MVFIGDLLTKIGNFFLKKPRLSMMVRIFDKMKLERKKLILLAADKFIKDNTI
jgi:deoxyribodipyrimidine photolyase-related protein